MKERTLESKRKAQQPEEPPLPSSSPTSPSVVCNVTIPSLPLLFQQPKQWMKEWGWHTLTGTTLRRMAKQTQETMHQDLKNQCVSAIHTNERMNR